MTKINLFIIGNAPNITHITTSLGDESPFAVPQQLTYEQLEAAPKDAENRLFLLVDETPTENPADEQAEKDYFKKIKKLKVLKSAPFAIISAKTDPKFCAGCYKAGALDILPLQSSPQELPVRLSSIMNSFAREQKGVEKLKGAQQVAFDAMEDAAEYGRVLQFLNRATECDTFEALAEAVMEVYKTLKLHGSAVIFNNGEDRFFSDDGKDRPIEMKLIQSVREKYIQDLVAQTNPKRILTSGPRVVTVGLNCGLLVRDADEERAGRLRDIIAGLITGLDARSHYIITVTRDNQRRDMLKEILMTVQQTVADFQMQFEQSEERSLGVIDDFMLTLNSGLAELALNEEQEQYFISAAETAMGSLVEQYKEQIKLRQKLDVILQSIQKLAKIV